MTTEATSHTPDEGLRILARIIARDWVKRYLPKERTGMGVDDTTRDERLADEPEPVPHV